MRYGHPVDEQQLVGLDAIDAVTRLLQRNRLAHPTAGAFDAAEIQWWWREPSSTDDLPQLVWFDDEGPTATAMLRDWSEGGSALTGEHSLTVLTLPDTSDETICVVVARGLAHACEHGIDAVEIEVELDDTATLAELRDRGFERTDDGVISGWLDASERPPVSPLPDGYELKTREETKQQQLPHPFIARNGPQVEERLLQTSLYRPDLDLVVYDDHGEPAAYGLFWYDPVTATGVVEPMRTNDDHQRRGLARHVLTAGVDRLAGVGAERVTIGWEPGNPASGPLYRSVGFVPGSQTDLYAGPTRS